MKGFEQVTLVWRDEEKIVQPDQVMGLINTIESVITMKQLLMGFGPAGHKNGKISEAYAAALNYAGFQNVQAHDVYCVLFDDDNAGVKVIETVNGLLTMLIPPKHLLDESQAGKQQGTSQNSD